LSRSVDRDRVHEAHPSYGIIIKQLSSDEGKILSLLNRQSYNHISTRTVDDSFLRREHVEFDDFPKADLTYPENFPFYWAQLNHLGLAAFFSPGELRETGPISETQFIPGAQGAVMRSRVIYALTSRGRRFMSACTSGGSQQ